MARESTGSRLRPWCRRPTLCSIVLCAGLFSLSPIPEAGEPTDDQALFVLDETVWATFYDLPSRRFRSIRDAFIRKDFEAAARDLQVSIGFMSIEAGRAISELNAPLTDNVAQLANLRARMREPAVSVGDLDAPFARAHWLLAQHYLVLAMQSRDAKKHKSAGRYLWATAHHLERAVLWSDARIDRSVVNALESSRRMASELQTSDRPERVYRDRPIAATARTLIRIGAHLERKVWVEESLRAVHPADSH